MRPVLNKKQKIITAYHALQVMMCGYYLLNPTTEIRKERRWWVKPWRARRTDRGTLHLLQHELRHEDPEEYKNFLRMDEASFNLLLSKVNNVITKQNTMRSSISAEDRLAVTLRFLATGESYKSLSQTTRISQSSLCSIIPEVCDAIYLILKDDYLKVNGTDVSAFPHEDAVKAFLTAEEPIVVELKRRVSDTQYDSRLPCSCLISTAVQTDISGIAWMEDPTLESFTHDIDLEEVTLRKCSSDEKLGLTVCYSSGSEVDTYTEVYIQEIVPHSVADRDGRLRHGDQILQVNGKDVSNKEETENLFAENSKAVTLLVSRCMNQNDDYGDANASCDFQNSDSPGSLPYQNSFIEQLIHQQHLESLQHSSTNETAPSVPPHLNLTNSLVRSKIDSISNEISKLDQRMQNIQLVRSERHKAVQNLPESDTEHIYETIPESLDSDLEPIYSYPYEPDQENMVKKWLNSKGTEWVDQQSRENKDKEMKAKENQLKSKSSKSNSSEEHENSSSAYNTGGSSNSNHLTFELGCYADPRQSETYRSTLILCSSSDKQTTKTTEALESCDTCKQAVGQKKKTKAINSKNSPSSPTQKPPPHVMSDTMYTNIANLQQTMLLQQELFRQALVHHDSSINRPTTSFTSPSLSQYQFSPNQYAHKKLHNSATVDTKMEWKVKKRPDGTRYIARRPIRNRILKNRAIRISEDRAGLTTEDDTISELKVGRYWTKEERKRHLEKSRERKQRQEVLSASKYVEEGDTKKIMEKLPSTSKKPPCQVDSTKKYKSKKVHKDGGNEFATVQDVLVHGPKMISNPNSKMIGLLSVTTV